ncbi:MAG: ABC transporter permease [Cytophagaceae bacterium SCN 52-12]|nr:MAG: ABC transporter permease [Cytophagaceae bacterium SCN 52-12]
MPEIKSAVLKQSSVFWWLAGAFILVVFGSIAYLSGDYWVRGFDQAGKFFSHDFFFYLLVGLGAQLVDGALGMAYGVTSTSFLLSLGVPPAISSASVHVAEIFTTGASAVSHFRFKNINKKLFRSLLIPGILGAVTGAYLLSDVIDGGVVKPFIAVYLAFLGVLILVKALAVKKKKSKTKRIGVLAAIGGFMDSIGGGGWGPIVTSTLLGQGRDPRYTIGSVNAAEFGVTFASGITFLILTGVSSWQVVAGLVIGGVIAAPFGALLVKRISKRTLMLVVAVLVIALSIRTIWISWL